MHEKSDRIKAKYKQQNRVSKIGQIQPKFLFLCSVGVLRKPGSGGLHDGI